MAKARLMLPFEALRGSIDKRDGVVFRQRNDTIEVYRARKRDYKKHPLRDGEYANVERFKQALNYWHRIRADPNGNECKNLYQLWKKQNQYKQFYHFVIAIRLKNKN